MKTEHIVIGMGEVGKAIQKVFDCDWVDIDAEDVYSDKHKIMHICLPYNKKFGELVKKYKKKFTPQYTVIHSTVPVGTSRKLNCLHSPIRGLHPNLYEGVMTFEKFIGGKDASAVVDDFRRVGLKVIICDTQEATELGKLLDTEYYRACIEFTLRAKNLCDKHKVPFHESYTLFNNTYNVGYTKLDHAEYVRPTLQPIMKTIGGHCVLPNSKLI